MTAQWSRQWSAPICLPLGQHCLRCGEISSSHRRCDKLPAARVWTTECAVSQFLTRWPGGIRGPCQATNSTGVHICLICRRSATLAGILANGGNVFQH
eukprot:362934-Chlamydomonas_euryale.AAC.6